MKRPKTYVVGDFSVTHGSNKFFTVASKETLLFSVSITIKFIYYGDDAKTEIYVSERTTHLSPGNSSKSIAEFWVNPTTMKTEYPGSWQIIKVANNASTQTSFLSIGGTILNYGYGAVSYSYDTEEKIGKYYVSLIAPFSNACDGVVISPADGSVSIGVIDCDKEKIYIGGLSSAASTNLLVYYFAWGN